MLARIPFVLHLDLHPDDPVVVLLQPTQLLLHMSAIPVAELDVPSGDHNFHVNLLVKDFLGWPCC